MSPTATDPEIAGETAHLEQRLVASDLNRMQQRFVSEYLVDFSATKAALRAGYSPKTAYQQGSALLRHPEIFRHVQDGLRALLARPISQADRVIQETVKLAFADLRRAFDPNGKLLPFSEFPDDLGPAIASIEVTHNIHGEQVTKIKLWDKTHALSLLAKIHKLLTTTHVQIGLSISAVPQAEDLKRMNDSQLAESARLLAAEALTLAKQLGAGTLPDVDVPLELKP